VAPEAAKAVATAALIASPSSVEDTANTDDIVITLEQTAPETTEPGKETSGNARRRRGRRGGRRRRREAGVAAEGSENALGLDEDDADDGDDAVNEPGESPTASTNDQPHRESSQNTLPAPALGDIAVASSTPASEVSESIAESKPQTSARPSAPVFVPVPMPISSTPERPESESPLAPSVEDSPVAVLPTVAETVSAPTASPDAVMPESPADVADVTPATSEDAHADEAGWDVISALATSAPIIAPVIETPPVVNDEPTPAHSATTFAEPMPEALPVVSATDTVKDEIPVETVSEPTDHVEPVKAADAATVASAPDVIASNDSPQQPRLI